MEDPCPTLCLCLSNKLINYKIIKQIACINKQQKSAQQILQITHCLESIMPLSTTASVSFQQLLYSVTLGSTSTGRASKAQFVEYIIKCSSSRCSVSLTVQCLFFRVIFADLRCVFILTFMSVTALVNLQPICKCSVYSLTRFH